MRLGWGFDKKKKQKITVEIVATNVVASRLPNGDRLECRPLVPILIFMLRNIDNILFGHFITTCYEKED